MAEKVRYTESEKGAPKVIPDGHMYTFEKKVAAGKSWRCDQRGECRGRITVDSKDQVVKTQEHSHAPDWGRCKAQECVVAMKRAAETSRASTSAIILSNVARVSLETAMKLPKTEFMKKTARMVKRLHLPPELTSLDDLGVPNKFKKTLKGKRKILLR